MPPRVLRLCDVNGHNTNFTSYLDLLVEAIVYGTRPPKVTVAADLCNSHLFWGGLDQFQRGDATVFASRQDNAFVQKCSNIRYLHDLSICSSLHLNTTDTQERILFNNYGQDIGPWGATLSKGPSLSRAALPLSSTTATSNGRLGIEIPAIHQPVISRHLIMYPALGQTTTSVPSCLHLLALQSTDPSLQYHH